MMSIVRQVSFIFISIILITMLIITVGCTCECEIPNIVDPTITDTNTVRLRGFFYEPSIYNGTWQGTVKGNFKYAAHGGDAIFTYEGPISLIALGTMNRSPVGDKCTSTDVSGKAYLTFRLVDFKSRQQGTIISWGPVYKEVVLHGWIHHYSPEHVEWMKSNSSSNIGIKPKSVDFQYATEDYLRMIITSYVPIIRSEITSEFAPHILHEFNYTCESVESLLLSRPLYDNDDPSDPNLYDPNIQIITENGSLSRIDSLPYPFTPGELIKTFPSMSCKWSSSTSIKSEQVITLPSNLTYKTVGDEVINNVDCVKVTLQSSYENESSTIEEYFWFSKDTDKCIKVENEKSDIRNRDPEEAAIMRFNPILYYLRHTWCSYCQMGSAIYWRDSNPNRVVISVEDEKFGNTIVNVIKEKYQIHGSDEFTEIWRGTVGELKMALLVYEFLSPDDWSKTEIISIELNSDIGDID